jgi:hypothetical protein
MSENRTIVIATPCGSSFVHSTFAASVAATAAELTRNGIGVRIFFTQGWEVSTQRDWLADLFLKESKASHLLFVDSDISFNPDLCLRLLHFKKEVVGAAYAMRRLELNKLRDGVKAGKSFERAWLDAHRFACSKPLRQEGPLIEVQQIGLGFTLLARSVFEKMITQCDLRRYHNSQADSHTTTAPLFGFFDRIDLPDGQRLGEDYAFCERWRTIGGQVWVDATAEIKHHGDFAVGVPLMAALRKDS